MLGNLMRHEIKATSRYFLPAYGALLLFAIINRIFMTLNLSSNSFLQIPQIVSIFLYGMLIMAIFVLTLVVMIQRFYKNLLCDEGYLMFTLPVKPWQLIFSKLVISMMWILVSFAATIASIFVMAIDSSVFQVIPAMFQELPRLFGHPETIHAIGFMVEFLLLIVFAMASSILMIYTSIAIGQMSKSHKLLVSFGVFMLINMILQVIFSTAIMIFATTPVANWVSSLPQLTMLHSLLIVQVLFHVGLSAAFFAITNFMLSKKLNLE